MNVADPATVARSTLRRLAQRQYAPTTDNCARVHRKNSGLPPEVDGWELLADWCARPSRDAPAAAHGANAAERATALRSNTLARAALQDPTALFTAILSLDRAGLVRQLIRPWALEHFGTFLEAADAPLAGQSKHLADALRAAERSSLPRLKELLRHLWLNLETNCADLAQREEPARRHLELMTDTLAGTTQGVSWLQAQLRTLPETLNSPLDLSALKQVGRSIKDAAIRQGTLRRSVEQSHQNLKNMIALFLDRLNSLVDETSQIERIGNASELEAQLARAAEAAREDLLTGALNRIGLDEAWHREASRADLHGSPLAVAMLDVDNFKQLNDTWGHPARDEALRFLARSMRQYLRPTDVVARHGGEEFVLLLPDTELNKAVIVLTRLQRELTQNNDERRPLITFSAGVTLYRPGEDENAVLDRADKAFYQARQAGKNRVAALPPPAGGEDL